MINQGGRGVNVKDAGDRAVSLFRSLDTERREHPIPRPALSLRFASRLFDCVVYALLALALLSGMRAALGRSPDPVGETAGSRESTPGIADLQDMIRWGPVTVDWTTAAALGLVLVMIVVLEVIQTRVLGATVGKRWNRIRVVRAGGYERAGSVQMAVRSAVLAVPFVAVVIFWFGSVLYAWAGLTALIAYGVFIGRDEYQRGPHDRLAGTEVFSTDVSAEQP